MITIHGRGQRGSEHHENSIVFRMICQMIEQLTLLYSFDLENETAYIIAIELDSR